jgi:hypothetical protein
MVPVEVIRPDTSAAKVKIGTIEALVANTANALRTSVTPGIMQSIRGGSAGGATSDRDSGGVMFRCDNMCNNPLRTFEVKHIVLGLVVHRLGVDLVACIAEIKVVANNALVANTDDSLVASIALGRVDGKGVRR